MSTREVLEGLDSVYISNIGLPQFSDQSLVNKWTKIAAGQSQM